MQKTQEQVTHLAPLRTILKDHLTNPAVQSNIVKLVDDLDAAKTEAHSSLARLIRQSCRKLTQDDMQGKYFGCSNLVR